MRSASVILFVIGSTAPVLAAQLAGAQSPAAARGQKDDNPFAGKVLVFQADEGLFETHEDVRIALLEGTAFLVLRPVVATHDGKTYAKQQVWRNTSTLRHLCVFETRTAADAFTKDQRRRIAKLNPGYRPAQLEYLPHPAAGDEPFTGKAVVVHWGNFEIPILTNDLKIHSMGNETFFSWSSDQLKGARLWKPLSIVNRIVVFDTFADAQSHFDAYMSPSELKGKKANSDTDQEQR